MRKIPDSAPHGSEAVDDSTLTDCIAAAAAALQRCGFEVIRP
jgi:hypothetical protein